MNRLVFCRPARSQNWLRVGCVGEDKLVRHCQWDLIGWCKTWIKLTKRNGSTGRPLFQVGRITSWQKQEWEGGHRNGPRRGWKEQSLYQWRQTKLGTVRDKIDLTCAQKHRLYWSLVKIDSLVSVQVSVLYWSWLQLDRICFVLFVLRFLYGENPYLVSLIDSVHFFCRWYSPDATKWLCTFYLCSDRSEESLQDLYGSLSTRRSEHENDPPHQLKFWIWVLFKTINWEYVTSF